VTDLPRRAFLGTAGAALAVSQFAPRVARAGANETIGVGCIGVGNRGSALLANLVKVQGVQVRAICDLLPEHVARAQKVVVDAGQPQPAGTAEWKKLLDMPGIDAIVSALPCDLHAANYLDVLAAGKDLYGEKPMCLSLADCDKVVAAAESSQRIVQIGFQRRADPRFIETIAQVHAGELGDLLEGRILWSNSWGPLYNWFGQAKRSGDWMVEQAVHNWDVMNWANQCLPVAAMGLGKNDLFREKQPDRDVHDYYAGVVQYANGVIVNIIHSWVACNKFNEEYTRLTGAKGGIDFNSGTFSYRPDAKRPDRVGHAYQGEINSTLLALEAWSKSLRSREKPIATVRHGRDAVLSCLMVKQAVYSKGVVGAGDLA
jgi:predicted dehydrogenase